ncbi:hypothetical protein HTVC168P_gp16 [Pelagibacter phage HTVC168P]|nr:hypothetical protein HTVC168P_gp16 [Pelagibacter phage HTVC168P]
MNTINIRDLNKKILKSKFVLIWWSDINSDSSWVSLEKAKSSKPTICMSTGWLIKNNKDVHIICNDVNFNEDGTLGDVGNVTTIPSVNVIKIVNVKI